MIVTIVRKPFKGSVGDNIKLHSSGAINIEGCRVGNEDTRSPTSLTALGQNSGWNNHKNRVVMAGSENGRWPANVVLSEKSTQHFPQSLGWSSQNHNTFNMYGGNSLLSSSTQRTGFHKGYDDSGSASRYFKTVKK